MFVAKLLCKVYQVTQGKIDYSFYVTQLTATSLLVASAFNKCRSDTADILPLEISKG